MLPHRPPRRRRVEATNLGNLPPARPSDDARAGPRLVEKTGRAGSMVLLLLLLLEISVPVAALARCDLSGEWRAVTGDPHSIYKFEQHGTGGFTVQLEPSQAQHWQHCTGNISAAGAVALQTDTGHTLTCDVNSKCSVLPWSHGPAWCRVGSIDCADPPRPRPAPPPPGASQRAPFALSQFLLQR